MATATMTTGSPVRWYNSLIVRIVALCAILVACLFSAVYFLTGHYYGQVIAAKQAQARQIADSLKVQFEAHPEIAEKLEELPQDIETPREGVPIRMRLVPWKEESDVISPQLSAQGVLYFQAKQTFRLDKDRWVELTVDLDVNPQTELIRAFKNRYLLALTFIFLVTLATMIYLIAKALQPIRRLSDTCTEISQGSLRNIDIRATSGEVRALEETFNHMVASLREKETVEANLRRAQRLSAIGNLAAGVAHDVRNPLNAIKLLSSQALDDLKAEGANGGPARALTTIRTEVKRLEDIVSGFLSLAKEEELRKEMRPLDPLLQECLNLVRKDAERRSVRLISELRTGDIELALDEKQMKRAVLNVLINALEVCPAGRRVRMFSRTVNDTCEIEIRDDGPGMTPEALEHAFDPYFTTKPTGTGLGLSITRGIIEEHGGTIRITSTPGQGTQVLIVLPMHATEDTPQEPAAGQPGKEATPPYAAVSDSG